jgi:hypothetical protein
MPGKQGDDPMENSNGNVEWRGILRRFASWRRRIKTQMEVDSFVQFLLLKALKVALRLVKIAFFLRQKRYSG